MPPSPLLLQTGAWLAALAGVLALLTVVGYWRSWAWRFRLVGVTSFTMLLAASCAAFAVSYSPRITVPGAVRVTVVFDNGADLVIAAAPANLDPAAIGPTLEELAANLRGGGRRSGDNNVHVRLRSLEPQADGSSRVVALGEALRSLSDGSVALVPAATGRTEN